ncbi:MAG: hypothetical protein HOE90_23490 [Bacteriovoracaceae bacterium]|nr:hypothetical protein [Bacteriovoracaceae bacterium]
MRNQNPIMILFIVASVLFSFELMSKGPSKSEGKKRGRKIARKCKRGLKRCLKKNDIATCLEKPKFQKCAKLKCAKSLCKASDISRKECREKVKGGELDESLNSCIAEIKVKLTEKFASTQSSVE